MISDYTKIINHAFDSAIEKSNRKGTNTQLDIVLTDPILLFGEVTEYEAERIISQMIEQAEKTDYKTITILIFSEGGSQTATSAIIDIMNILRHRGVKITAIATGEIAAQATRIWLSADERYTTRNARIRIDSVSAQLGQDQGENFRLIRDRDHEERTLRKRLDFLSGCHHLSELLAAEGKAILSSIEAAEWGLSSVVK